MHYDTIVDILENSLEMANLAELQLVAGVFKCRCFMRFYTVWIEFGGQERQIYHF